MTDPALSSHTSSAAAKPNQGQIRRSSRFLSEAQGIGDRLQLRYGADDVSGQAQGEAVEHQFGELAASGVRARTSLNRTSQVECSDRAAEWVGDQTHVQSLEHHITGGGNVDTCERLGGLKHHGNGAGRAAEVGAHGGAEPEHVGSLARVPDHRLRPGDQHVGLGQ